MSAETPNRDTHLRAEIAELEKTLGEFSGSPDDYPAVKEVLDEWRGELQRVGLGKGMPVPLNVTSGRDTVVGSDIKIVNYLSIIRSSPTIQARAKRLESLLRQIADEERKRLQSKEVVAGGKPVVGLNDVRSLIARALCQWTVEDAERSLSDRGQQPLPAYLRLTIVASGLVPLITRSRLPQGAKQALIQLASLSLAICVFRQRRSHLFHRVLSQPVIRDAIILNLKDELKAEIYVAGIVALLDDLCDPDRGLAALALAFTAAEAEGKPTPLIIWLMAADSLDGVRRGMSLFVDRAASAAPAAPADRAGAILTHADRAALALPVVPPDHAAVLFERAQSLVTPALLALAVGVGGYVAARQLAPASPAPSVVVIAPTATSTPSAAPTPTERPTPTVMLSPTATPVPPTATAAPSETPRPTDTPVPPTAVPTIRPTATLPPAPSHTPAPLPTAVVAIPPTNEALEREAADLINERRAENGCDVALAYSPDLANAARRHSYDMAVNNYLSHTGADGSTLEQRVREAGYLWATPRGEPILLEETIGARLDRPATLIDEWMNNSAHREIILNCRFREVGIGFVQRDESEYTYYWTAVFTMGRR
ncbi:MAG: hypothetical protein HGA45_01690 [Chloroflexales bacterium]|nr:hypothetical protein [Chloroflexales bacterium]